MTPYSLSPTGIEEFVTQANDNYRKKVEALEEQEADGSTDDARPTEEDSTELDQ